MNCTDARQNWMLFLDSEGDPELHLRMREHIGGCPDCAAWFTQQATIERTITTTLASGPVTPDLWQRVMSRAQAEPSTQRRRWVALAAVVTAAAVLIPLLLVFRGREDSAPTELTRNAAEWHEQWQRGNVRPELESTSDHEVDRYLKARVPFRVHCPPRTDVHFSVRGAGVCFMKGRQQAAYIVGNVGQSPVTILVLDRGDLGAFPPGFHHRNEGGYQAASAVIADNVVIVIGTVAPDVLDRLLNAYGSYHEG